MKNLILSLLLLVSVATAQVGPPPASPAEVAAGINNYKYLTPYNAAQAGLSSPTGGISAAVAVTIAQTNAVYYSTNGSGTFNGNGGGLTNVTAQYVFNADELDATLAPYNVVADGTTDNSVGIQLALNTVGYSNTVYRTVVLPKGVIVVTNNIALPRSGNRIEWLENGFPATNSYSIKGRGRGVTWLDGRNLPTNGILFDFNSPNVTNKLSGFRMSDLAMIGPNMRNDGTTTAPNFSPNYLYTNNFTTGLRFYSPPTFSQVSHFMDIQNVEIWGFGTNLSLTDTTESTFRQCRFFTASKADFHGIRNDQLLFDSCSFGWEGYVNNSSAAAAFGAGFKASVVCQGTSGAGDPTGLNSGRGTTFLNCEIYYAPRLGWIDDDVVSFPSGYNLEMNSYVGGTEMFIITNVAWVSFGTGSFNNWNTATTNEVVFRTFNFNANQLVIDGAFFNVSSARLFAQTDGANAGIGDQVGVSWPQIRASSSWDINIPQIVHTDYANTATNYYFPGASDRYWSYDLPIAQPDLNYDPAAWVPTTVTPTLQLGGAVEIKTTGLPITYYRAPGAKDRGIKWVRFTVTLQGDTGITNQYVSATFSTTRITPTGGFVNDYPYATVFTNVTAGTLSTKSFIAGWANDSDIRQLYVSFNPPPTNRVWLININCHALK